MSLRVSVKCGIMWINILWNNVKQFDITTFVGFVLVRRSPTEHLNINHWDYSINPAHSDHHFVSCFLLFLAFHCQHLRLMLIQMTKYSVNWFWVSVFWRDLVKRLDLIFLVKRIKTNFGSHRKIKTLQGSNNCCCAASPTYYYFTSS